MHGDQPFKQQLLSSKNVIESFKPLSEKTQKAKLELISILNRQEPSKQVPTPNSNQGTSGFGNLPSIPSMPSFGNMPNMPSFGNMSNGMSRNIFFIFHTAKISKKF